MRKQLAVLVIAAMAVGMIGCGKTETPAAGTVDSMETEQAGLEEVEEAEIKEIEEVKEETAAEETEEAEETTEVIAEELLGDGDILDGEFIPANAMESRCGKDAFDSCEEIISLLEAPEAYAYVNMKGMDEPILLVAEDTFGGDDLGYYGALEATPYAKGADGKYHAGSVFWTISTGTPLAMSDDGMIYCATHDSMDVQCYGENGTDTPAIMIMMTVHADYDDNGNPINISGFKRDKNTVVDNPGVTFEADDVEAFEGAFKDYEKCTPINFTPV